MLIVQYTWYFELMWSMYRCDYNQILPILEHDCPLWLTGKEIHALEIVQLNYIKATLGAKKTGCMVILADFHCYI